MQVEAAIGHPRTGHARTQSLLSSTSRIRDDERDTTTSHETSAEVTNTFHRLKKSNTAEVLMIQRFRRSTPARPGWACILFLPTLIQIQLAIRQLERKLLPNKLLSDIPEPLSVGLFTTGQMILTLNS